MQSGHWKEVSFHGVVYNCDYKVSPCTHTHAHQLQETSKALEVIGKPFEQWYSVLHDQWKVAGILGGITYGADGLPFITSHYGYFMSSWHIVMALSGQIANMTEKSLTFAPRLDPPYSLPVFLPAVWGHLQARYQHIIERWCPVYSQP